MLRLTTLSDGQTGLHIDLATFEAPMKAALKRAVIFLSYSHYSAKIPPLTTVKLMAAIDIDVGVPDPIPPAERKIYQSEFTSWSIGQGLIELDQSYQRYVVSALNSISLIDAFLANGTLPDTPKPNLANTWTVHEQFYDAVGQRTNENNEESGCLRTLGNARNCLAHDSGLVTERRLTDNFSMPVKWLGRELILTTLGGERSILPRARGHRVREQDVGATLSVDEVLRTQVYNIGAHVSFSQTDLSEIIFFYQYLAMRVGVAMHALVARKLQYSERLSFG